MSTRDLVLGIGIGGVAVLGLAIVLPVLAGAVAAPLGPSFGMQGPGPMGGMGRMMDHDNTNASEMHDHCSMMAHGEHDHRHEGDQKHEKGHEHANETHTHTETSTPSSLAGEVITR